ncbi:MAG: cytochrome c [Vicingaceae bacterium]|nr:cytochrome c [Vicingaceae bacterium]
MRMIKFFAIPFLGMVFFSCGGDATTSASTESKTTAEEVIVKEAAPTDPMTNKGIGPISNVELAAIDDAMANEGEAVFAAKCTACHKIGKRYIGPDLTGVITRRTPEWIMNMIMNPEEMVANDPIAKELLMEYSAPMANQSLTEDETRKILEYFRTI